MLPSSRKRLLVLFILASAVRMPVALAQDQNVFADVSNLVYEVIAICYALIIPFILLGLAIGYVEVAGPWSLQTLKKQGRTQIEMGFITLFVFLISPALLAFLMWLGTSLSAASGGWP